MGTHLMFSHLMFSHLMFSYLVAESGTQFASVDMSSDMPPGEASSGQEWY